MYTFKVIVHDFSQPAQMLAMSTFRGGLFVLVLLKWPLSQGTVFRIIRELELWFRIIKKYFCPKLVPTKKAGVYHRPSGFTKSI